MKKTFIALLGTLFLNHFSFAEDGLENKLKLSCESNSDLKGSMAFTLNWATKTILFSDIEVFGQAQILKDTPISATAKFNNHNVKIKFTYDWYYTAAYEIIINMPITELNSNTTNVPVTLNGDDSDGAVFNNVKFNCSVL